MKKTRTTDTYNVEIDTDKLFELFEVPDHIESFWIHSNKEHSGSLPYTQVTRKNPKVEANANVETKYD